MTLKQKYDLLLLLETKFYEARYLLCLAYHCISNTENNARGIIATHVLLTGCIVCWVAFKYFLDYLNFSGYLFSD